MMALRRFYSRKYISSKYLKKSKQDPGIHYQQKILESSENDLDSIDFEELESDFLTVHKSHREHVEQMEQWQEKEKYLIVKNKYFKDKYPNFLTWHDKEQIRYLYNSDPEEWSIERLSEGFPAMPDVIEKIVKAKWTKKNQTKITNHDHSVMRNWIEFKNGKIEDLPDELAEHLKKFSDRSLNFKPFEIPHEEGKIVQNTNFEENVGEFSEIIMSYQRLKNKDCEKSNDKKKDRMANAHSEKMLQNKTLRKNTKLVTFKELQQNIGKSASKGINLSAEEKVLLKESSGNTESETNNAVELKPEEITRIVENRYQNDKIGFVRKTTRDVSHLIYPEKIIIPKKCYKKGYTYRLNDCYYDSDGEFLYRVPGMG